MCSIHLSLGHNYIQITPLILQKILHIYIYIYIQVRQTIQFLYPTRKVYGIKSRNFTKIYLYIAYIYGSYSFNIIFDAF